LIAIEIFGYRNPQTKSYAVNLGIALQMVNIIRDVGSDADLAAVGSLQPGEILLLENVRFNAGEDLIDKAKKNPKGISCGAVMAADAYFNLQILQKAAGVEFKPVPFTGSAPADVALLEIIEEKIGWEIPEPVELVREKPKRKSRKH
jgi:hypothetical protein